MKLLNMTLIFVYLVSIGCSSRGALNIQTAPQDAEVQVVVKSGKINTIGKTPYKGLTEDLFKEGGEFVQLRINKLGYKLEEILIEKPVLGKNIELNYTLNPEITSDASTQYMILAKGIAKAVKDIQAQRLDAAEIILLALLKDFPEVGVVYDFLGNISYMRKDFKQAMAYYERAKTLDPKVEERDKLMRKISVIMGKDN